MELDDLIKSFESDNRDKKQRFHEFCYHCWFVLEKQIKSCKSDKLINKYNTMRTKTLEYIVANEKSITQKLSR
jgi:hypothetical protein